MKNKSSMLLCLLLLIFIFGCEVKNNQSNSESDGGSVRITLPGGSKNAGFLSRALALNSPDNIVRYDITFTSDNLYYFTETTAVPGETVTLTELLPGLYAMEILAYDSEETAIYGGEDSNIEVLARNTTYVTIMLKDLIGDSILIESPPWAPWDLNYAIASGTQVDLTWRDNSAIEEGYRVYKMVLPDNQFVLIADLGPDSISYSDSSYTATSEQTWYRICAYNIYGESNFDAVHFPEGSITRFDTDEARFDQCLFER